MKLKGPWLKDGDDPSVRSLAETRWRSPTIIRTKCSVRASTTVTLFVESESSLMADSSVCKLTHERGCTAKGKALQVCRRL
jgi:hypothetical protein